MNNRLWFLIINLILSIGLVPISSCTCQNHQDTTKTETESTYRPVTITESGEELPFETSVGFSNSFFLPGEVISYGYGIVSADNITIDPFPPVGWVKSLDNDTYVYAPEGGNRTRDLIPSFASGAWRTDDHRSKCQMMPVDANGEQLPPGLYEVGIEWRVVHRDTGEWYTLNTTATFTIVEPDSALYKDMEVNQQTTSEGITATLLYVELNPVQCKISVNVTPPDYHYPFTPEEDQEPDEGGLMSGLDTEWISDFVHNTVAEYRIDDGAFIQPVSGGTSGNSNGMTLRWEFDPVPLDARILVFRITRFGDTEGLWEFEIPLDKDDE